MAAGFFVPLAKLFSSGSWKTVVTNAPAIVDAAAALWSKVARTPAVATRPPDSSLLEQSDSLAESLSSVEGRVRSVEQAIAKMQVEALSSSELLKSLAEQNAKLVQGVEFLRARMVVLSIAAILLTIAAVAAFALALAR